MAVFKNLYERAILWAAHPLASYFLTLLSFIEAIFFPIPPETMLAPMSLARPKKAFWFASLSLFGSMTGMFIGYAIGHYFIDLAMPFIDKMGYAAQFEDIKQQAANNGFWLLLLAGFTPIPFKIFTLASGAVGMPLAAVFLRRPDRPGQARVSGRRRHFHGRRKSRSQAAPVHRTDWLDGFSPVHRRHRLFAIEAMKPGNRCLARLTALSLLMGLAACQSGYQSTKNTKPSAAQKPVSTDTQAIGASYTVKPGDTLFGIAFRAGLNYRDVAAWNGIEEPYTIRLRAETADVAGQTVQRQPENGENGTATAQCQTDFEQTDGGYRAYAGEKRSAACCIEHFLAMAGQRRAGRQVCCR